MNGVRRVGILTGGGAPSSADRILASRFGGKAIEFVRNRQYGMMVAARPPDIVPVPFQEVVGKTKLVPLDGDLMQTARALGISFGD